MADAGAADENVCRDFLRNQCKRGDGCKFTHPNTSVRTVDRAIDDNVCRDYVRNVCKRGISCKFTHPQNSGEAPPPPGKGLQSKVMFCHDFQNSRCTRANCTFIHCTKELENEYLASGYLPPLVRDQAISKGVAVDFPASVGGTPVCKDFLTGKCNRGSRCKFRHLSPREYDIEMSGFSQHGPPANLFHAFSDEDEFRGPHDRKRRLIEAPPIGLEFGPNPQEFFMLQEENCQLKGRIQELEKKVSDLLATNEFLLDQNAQLRMGGAGPPPTQMFVRRM